MKVIFIGEDIEMRIVFKNALTQLDKKVRAEYFFESDAACRFMNSEKNYCPNFIFLNASTSNSSCLMEIDVIKEYAKANECQIVMFDTYSVLKNTTGIFAMGVDVFVPKPYDFIPFKRKLRQILFANEISQPKKHIITSSFDF